MRILITGGAGCLGSNLIEYWLPRGHEILIIDNFTTGNREALPPIAGLTVVEGTIVDAGLVEQTFSEFRPTYVIHAAASYKDRDWQSDAATNIIGTINVINAARAANVARLIYFHTVLCYGRPRLIPTPVDHPLQPFTSYAISKTAGEQYIAASGLPWVSMRLANVTGPRLAAGPIPTFYKRIKAGQPCICSNTVRDFLDMADFFTALDLVMNEAAPTGIFNVASGEGHSIREVYDATRAHLGLAPDLDVKVVPAGPDDVPVVVPDPSRTWDVLGWRARTPFGDTVHRMLQWYDLHGVTDVHSHLAAPKPA